MRINARERPIFDRAVRRGELRADADPMLIIDLLAGAVWLRAVFRGLPLDDDFTEQAVNLVLDGAALPTSNACGTAASDHAVSSPRSRPSHPR